jgi:glutathione S-transferase
LPRRACGRPGMILGLVREWIAEMSELTIWTYDCVPEGPRGFVRDLRLRWACEEADLSYAVRTIPFDGRETNHLTRQPFGQVPYLNDGALELFESGACLLHLAGMSEKLMPTDPLGAAETLQWTIAALNSIEMVTVPWWFLKMCGDRDNQLTGWMGKRLDHIERILRERQWLATDRFTVADLLMADVLRVPDVRAGTGPRPRPMWPVRPIAPLSSGREQIKLSFSRRPTRREQKKV